MKLSFTPPGREALEVSAALKRRIVDEVRAQSGWLSFARFMEFALYTPQLGYYMGGTTKIGAHGDFTTAPEMSPLFGRALARQVAQTLQLGSACVTEFGAGTGRLAAVMLAELEALGAAPQRYAILELSGQLRERQRTTIEKAVPALLPRVVWLDAMPERLDGAVVGNEVLDALPVHLAVRGESGWLERGVAVNAEEQLHYADRPAGEELIEAIHWFRRDMDLPAPGYLSEVPIATRGLVNTIAQRLIQGVALWIDYGFPAREYYHPQRSTGTLMAHYRHHAHDDPFLWPGLQDLTAHVDFSAVARAAHEAGADLLGYTSQAHFLINCGIATLIDGNPADAATWLPQSNALQRLVSEAEMGELFKVIAWGKNIEVPLIGFARGDRRHSLT